MLSKKLFALLFVLVMGVGSFVPTATAQEKERCHGYCLIEFLQQTGGFYYFEAQRCKDCGEVSLKCTSDHFTDGSECKNCKGTCPGHNLPDCVETTDELPVAAPAPTPTPTPVHP